MAYNLSGNAGVAGATVAWSGTTSGSTVADSLGNFSAVGVLTSGGDYTITPSLALPPYTFSPSSYYYPGVTQNLNYTFTATPVPLAQILQKVSQINTTGSDTASVTFTNPIQATSGLIVAVMAVDTGAAIAADSYGTTGTAPGYASVTDTLSNSLAPIGSTVAIWGDQTHGTTLFCGIYMQLNAGDITGGSDTVTFTFTPLSASANCVVGIVAYEVESISPGGDTANTDIAGENGSLGCYPITFPPDYGLVVNGNITLGGATNLYGLFAITCAVATTTDGSTFNKGSKSATNPYTQPPVVGEMGWSLDAAGAALVNGVQVALAVQEEFCTGNAMNNPCTFGTTPTNAHGISGASVAYGTELLNVYVNATYSVSGSAGVPNATVSYTGTASGSATANSSGNYSLAALPLGSYTITPGLAGYGFSPTSQSVTVSAGNVPPINFTAAEQFAPAAQPLKVSSSQGNYSVVDNGASSASVTANNPLIQSIQFANAAAASCAFPSPNTSGNLLVAAFRGNVSGASVVTDSNKNLWTRAVSQITTAGTSATEIWFAANCAVGANTVAVTKSESQMVIAEYSGVQASALSQTNSASAYNTTYSVPVTIQAPYALLIGAVANDTASNRTDVPSGGFSDEQNASKNVFLADQIVSLPGTYTYGGTIPGENVKWAACVAVFLPQASNAWTGDRFGANSRAIASNGNANVYSNETIPDFVANQEVIITNLRVSFSNPS